MQNDVSTTSSSVKVGQYLSEIFDTVPGFRKGDCLAFDCLKCIMKSVLKQAGFNANDI